MDRTRIPSIEKEWSVGQKEYMGVFDQVEFILQGENNPDDPPPYNYIRDVYKSCMDMEAIDAESRDQDVKDWLRTNIGEWPLLNDTSDEEPFNLTKALINSNRYGTSPIIDMWVAADKKNSTVNILYMDKPDLGMGWGSNSLYKQNGTDLMAYETYIYEVAKTLGFANSSTAKADVADIVDFEIQLAEISGNEEKSRDPNDMYNPMTLADVHGNYSSDKFNFEIFFKGIMGLPGIGVDVTDSEIIINEFPLYFQNLTQLFKQTPIKTIANYVMWIFTQTLIDDLREEIRDHKFQYLKVREQVQGKRTRGFTCTEFFFANKNLQMAIGKPFVERYSNRDAKILGHEMLVKIKEAFIELMYTLDWMDEDTRKLSREKLKFMKDKIGYPDYLDNVTFYTKLYENYTFKSEGFFENRLVVVQQYTIEKLKVLRRPVDKTKWPNGPTIVNGYQDNSKNEIIVLSAFFQPPFFSAEYPMYLNYGGIGVTIAHEVSHSFDNTGRKYDKYGNLKEMWTEDMIEKYENVSQCMKDQYGAFYSHEANESLNADVMMREIVGDNGGLRQSFRAYRDWVTSRGQEERLLFGVNYTQNQLFFIQQAQFLCQKYRPKVYAERFKVSYHPPAPFRVWGMVQNSVDFAKAFNCPSGSPMSSVHKCTVW
jgi:membrane metallo-endopeptidase-like protein 1